MCITEAAVLSPNPNTVWAHLIMLFIHILTCLYFLSGQNNLQGRFGRDLGQPIWFKSDARWMPVLWPSSSFHRPFFQYGWHLLRRSCNFMAKHSGWHIGSTTLCIVCLWIHPLPCLRMKRLLRGSQFDNTTFSLLINTHCPSWGYRFAFYCRVQG